MADREENLAKLAEAMKDAAKQSVAQGAGGDPNDPGTKAALFGSVNLWATVAAAIIDLVEEMARDAVKRYLQEEPKTTEPPAPDPAA